MLRKQQHQNQEEQMPLKAARGKCEKQNDSVAQEQPKDSLESDMKNNTAKSVFPIKESPSSPSCAKGVRNDTKEATYKTEITGKLTEEQQHVLLRKCMEFKSTNHDLQEKVVSLIQSQGVLQRTIAQISSENEQLRFKEDSPTEPNVDAQKEENDEHERSLRHELSKVREQLKQKEEKCDDQENLIHSLQSDLKERDSQHRSVTQSLTLVTCQQAEDRKSVEELREYLAHEKAKHRATKMALKELEAKMNMQAKMSII